jgi:HEAT repeat protein
MQFEEESKALKSSSWPRCDSLAAGLAARGVAAADALEAAAKSRTHHVRSAALKALVSVAPERGKALAELLLNDKAYEVRETAALILGCPIPG